MEGAGANTPLAGRASYAGAYDAGTPRDGLRFVNDMLAAGTAEEVLRLAAASVPRDQWAGLLRSLNVDTTETDSIRLGESEEVTQRR